MAYEAAQVRLGTLTAAADLSGKQFHFVKLASATTVNVCSAITDKPIGVLQNTPTSGGVAEICIFGITKVVADATYSAGAVLGTSNDGQAKAIVAGTDVTQYALGQAIEAGVAGNIVTMFLNPSNTRAA